MSTSRPLPMRGPSAKRQILVVNGLQFEGWLDRLIDASDFRGIRVVATEGHRADRVRREQRSEHLDVHAEEAGHHHDTMTTER